MHLHDLSEKLTTGFDEIRDRTADVVGGDGGSVFREFGRLGKQLTEVEKHLSTKLDEMQEEQTDLLDDLLSADNRTTWPRRLFWLLIGAAAGYGTAFLTDPDRGPQRRQQLGQELSTRADEVKGQVMTQTEQLRDKASAQASQAVDAAAQKADELRGQATQAAAQKTEELRGQAEQTLAKAQGTARDALKDAMPDRPTDDPGLLEDKIKSEVFGYRDDVQDVIIKVEGPGAVSLKGTVPTPQNERDLLAAVAEVDGVIDVRSELTVRSI
ncbi:MAG: BON domain-containing protein [Egicoccus sp.]